MILGVGTDLVNVKHFKETLRKTPSVVGRVFTKEEQDFSKHLSASRKISYYAKRFAAKEAVSKAMGTGIGEKISWQDICILNDKEGAPVVSISPKALQFLQKKFHAKKIQVFLSLTDEREYAMAFVVLSK